MRKLIILISFSQSTPLHWSALCDHLAITRLLVESNADVAARDRCFSPPPSHHLALTIYLTAMAKLHSKWPSSATIPTLLHTCAASARLHDAPPPRCRCPNTNCSCSCRPTDRHCFFWGGIGSCKKIDRNGNINTSLRASMTRFFPKCKNIFPSCCRCRLANTVETPMWGGGGGGGGYGLFYF